MEDGTVNLNHYKLTLEIIHVAESHVSGGNFTSGSNLQVEYNIQGGINLLKGANFKHIIHYI